MKTKLKRQLFWYPQEMKSFWYLRHMSVCHVSVFVICHVSSHVCVVSCHLSVFHFRRLIFVINVISHLYVICQSCGLYWVVQSKCDAIEILTVMSRSQIQRNDKSIERTKQGTMNNEIGKLAILEETAKMSPGNPDRCSKRLQQELTIRLGAQH